MTSVSELLEAIERNGDEADSASLILGLLIEQEHVRRPAHHDGGVNAVLEEPWTNRRLSVSEMRMAVDRLLTYVARTAKPRPMAVWALTKSYDLRIVAPLVEILSRVVRRPEDEHLAYQALIGIINTAPNEPASISAIQTAADEGHGRVKETAAAYVALTNARPTNRRTD